MAIDVFIIQHALNEIQSKVEQKLRHGGNPKTKIILGNVRRSDKLCRGNKRGKVSSKKSSSTNEILLPITNELCAEWSNFTDQ